MATWIAHLRIAENLLNEIKAIEKIPFVVGNIAPDSGVPNEDWSSFDPPSAITHWLKEDRSVNSDAFYNKYLRDKKNKEDSELHSFLLGYYTHLLADIEWEKLYVIKMSEPLYKDNLEKDPKFIWKIKKDWYGQDFEYLKNNKDSLFYNCFQHITQAKDYLDYFPKGAFTDRLTYIREFYQQSYDRKEEFIYLSKEEMDEFVETASSNIKETLRLRLIDFL